MADEFVVELSAEVNEDQLKNMEKEIKRVTDKISEVKLSIEDNGGELEGVVTRFKQVDNYAEGVKRTTSILTADIDGIKKTYKTIAEGGKDSASSLRQQIRQAGQDLQKIQTQLNSSIASGTQNLTKTLRKNVSKVNDEIKDLQQKYTKLVGADESKKFVRQATRGYEGTILSGVTKREQNSLTEYRKNLSKIISMNVDLARYKREMVVGTEAERNELRKHIEETKRLLHKETARNGVLKKRIQSEEALGARIKADEEAQLAIKKKINEETKKEAKTREVASLSEYSKNLKEVEKATLKNIELQKQLDSVSAEESVNIQNSIKLNNELIDTLEKRNKVLKTQIKSRDGVSKKQIEEEKSKKNIAFKIQKQQIQDTVKREKEAIHSYSQAIKESSTASIALIDAKSKLKTAGENEARELNNLIPIYEKQIEAQESLANQALEQIKSKKGLQEANKIYEEQHKSHTLKAGTIFQKEAKAMDVEAAKQESKAISDLNKLLKEYNSLSLDKIKLTLAQKDASEKGKASIQKTIDLIDEQINAKIKEAESIKDTIKSKEKQAEADDNIIQSTKKLELETEKLKLKYDDLKEKTFGLAEMIMNQLVNRAMNMLISQIKQAISTIRELNVAMTDVQMVTEYSQDRIASMAKEYSNLAEKYGATTKQVAEGASEWLRQGKTAEETSKLLETSLVMSKVGAIEASEATTLLTSTMNGFKLQVDDAMHVVDAMSAIDLAAATSVEEIATALQKTSNSARTAGVSFEELIGYVSAVSEATRQAPEIVGTQFKTLFSRYSNIAAGKNIDDFGESIDICGIQA